MRRSVIFVGFKERVYRAFSRDQVEELSIFTTGDAHFHRRSSRSATH